MANLKGIASYCQECGACTVNNQSCSSQQLDDYFVKIVVNEVIKNVYPDLKPQVESESVYPPIPLGVSNHHVHITKETFEKLFGAGKELEHYRDLYQPNEFAAKQMVTIAGPKMRAIQNVRILGPLRKYDQVEVSLTDAIQLGISPPIHNSGDLEGAAPLTLIGPKSSIYLEHCAIIANRHMHMTSHDAQLFGVEDGDFCKVRIGGEKGTVFENVLVRVNDNWKLQLHLDTDDANAANVRCSMHVEFVGKI
ncbi:phosphate propanoyltransferase [bacterium]|nr:phosphate propanoyltransferase [bacterium]RQV97750.1 MAG: phosphate propanoyltransferase [bacterium]